MKIKITSDSTCDLTPELYAKYDITNMPLRVMLGDEEFSDGVDINPPKIYDFVAKTSLLPKTAARNAAEYEEFFAKQLEQADCVIHYGLSSEMSASCNEAKKAAQLFNGKVFVVDTLALSTGSALFAIDAVECVQKGMTPEEIVARSESRVDANQTSFIIDKLDYLFKGGRCSRLQMLGSNILKIKPSILMKKGALHVGDKYRGRLAVSVAAYVNQTLKTFHTPDLTRIFVTHTQMDQEIVDSVMKQIAEQFPFKEIIDTTAGSTITSHCGPGTIGILYFNDGDTYQ